MTIRRSDAPDHGPGHDHRFPRGILALIVLCVTGLLVGVILSFTYAQSVEQRLGRLQEYVEGRGDFRDAEADRLEDSIDRAICRLLDQLPAYEGLNRVRQSYDCGPGLPLDDDPSDAPTVS